MIEIDGSIGEGGGQILRTASALSLITGKPIFVSNVRKGRKKPGLRTQHLLGLRALADLCQGILEGDKLASQEIKFHPGSDYRDRISITIPTAGSITLLLQSLIPPALFAPHPIEIFFNGGGTDTFFSPTLDYFRFVFLKILEKMLIPLSKDKKSPRIEIEVLKRGYYPAGGGKVNVKIRPAKLKSINLTKREKLEKILILSGASESLKPKKVAERQIAGTREIFGKFKLPVEEKTEYHKTACPGSHICLVAQFENTILGTDNLGKLGKRAEDVGKEATLELIKEQKTKACVDKHLGDQLLSFMALSQKKSEVTVSEITNHCKTNIWIIEKFLDGKFEIKDNLIRWLPG